jgi:hypothetical protein
MGWAAVDQSAILVGCLGHSRQAQRFAKPFEAEKFCEIFETLLFYTPFPRRVNLGTFDLSAALCTLTHNAQRIRDGDYPQ